METDIEPFLTGNTLAIGVASLSVALSVTSLYFSRLRPGRLKVPPLRAYRVEPLNYNSGGESIRIFRLYVPMTLMNTGTHQRAISDLRVVIPIKGIGMLPLRWEMELPSLDADPNHHGGFAGQPTLQTYESTSRVYTFITPFNPEAGKMVEAIEQQGNNGGFFTASLETRKATNQWQSLLHFRFDYAGSNRIETDFDKINSSGS